ncbi:MAG: hypothetical protein H6914_00295 [Novosphingobium sp.]|nr:hypothetical protein [Novosphingobium sp.]
MRPVLPSKNARRKQPPAAHRQFVHLQRESSPVLTERACDGCACCIETQEEEWQSRASAAHGAIGKCQRHVIARHRNRAQFLLQLRESITHFKGFPPVWILPPGNLSQTCMDPFRWPALEQKRSLNGCQRAATTSMNVGKFGERYSRETICCGISGIKSHLSEPI